MNLFAASFFLSPSKKNLLSPEKKMTAASASIGLHHIGYGPTSYYKLLQLTSLSAPTCIRTAKFVRWLQVHVISVLVLLTIEHPLLDQEPMKFDLQ